MELEEICLGSCTDDRYKAVKDHLAREVVLRDAHKSWCYGILLEKRWNSEIYIIREGDEEKQLNYSDLRKLFFIIDDDSSQKN